jgi:hypothetical protein
MYTTVSHDGFSVQRPAREPDPLCPHEVFTPLAFFLAHLSSLLSVGVSHQSIKRWFSCRRFDWPCPHISVILAAGLPIFISHPLLSIQEEFESATECHNLSGRSSNDLDIPAVTTLFDPVVTVRDRHVFSPGWRSDYFRVYFLFHILLSSV